MTDSTCWAALCSEHDTSFSCFLLQVFLYVMHGKKAQVPKEEFDAIRQCQKEEKERNKHGLQPPWQDEPLAQTPGLSAGQYSSAVTPDQMRYGNPPATRVAAGQDWVHPGGKCG